MSRFFLTFSVPLLSLLSLAACGSSTGGTGGTGGNAGSATTSSSSTSSSSGSTSSSSGTGGAGTGGSTSSSAGTGGSAPITSCTELNATDCFSNYDCTSASDRCENKGTEANQVPCCVPGPRGTGVGGDSCQDANDCDTGLCVIDEPSPGMNRCSQVCDTDADCPPDVPTCVTLVAGANGSFCL